MGVLDVLGGLATGVNMDTAAQAEGSRLGQQDALARQRALLQMMAERAIARKTGAEADYDEQSLQPRLDDLTAQAKQRLAYVDPNSPYGQYRAAQTLKLNADAGLKNVQAGQGGFRPAAPRAPSAGRGGQPLPLDQRVRIRAQQISDQGTTGPMGKRRVPWATAVDQALAEYPEAPPTLRQQLISQPVAPGVVTPTASVIAPPAETDAQRIARLRAAVSSRTADGSNDE